MPEFGLRMPRMALTVVLLPLPLGPIRVTISPLLTDRLTSLNNVVLPRLTDNLTTSISLLLSGVEPKGAEERLGMGGYLRTL